MAETSGTEIKTWLTLILKKDNLTNLSVDVLGTSEKGDGYLGDIVFVHATGTVEDGSTKEYNLVLKCSKRSQLLRETVSVKEFFAKEIFLYDELLPSFKKFQQVKGVEEPFQSVPKCYGTFTGENVEVIVLENVKKRGFELWPKKHPLTRKHIDLVVKEYGKFHAISIAMKEHQPDQFQKFVNTLLDYNVESVSRTRSMQSVFESSIDEVYEVLKNDFDEHVLLRWRKLKEQAGVVYNSRENPAGLKVITHGDCWSNNFMYKYDGLNKIPYEVMILDWQITRYSSPVFDLSYFLFTCISKEDIENLDDILKNYHKIFVKQLTALGASNPDAIYPFNEFLADWNKYCRYGIVLASLMMKVCSSDKDEVVDIAETANSGKDFTANFRNEIKDKDNFRNRMRHIVEYAAKYQLI